MDSSFVVDVSVCKVKIFVSVDILSHTLADDHQYLA